MYIDAEIGERYCWDLVRVGTIPVYPPVEVEIENWVEL